MLPYELCTFAFVELDDLISWTQNETFEAIPRVHRIRHLKFGLGWIWSDTARLAHMGFGSLKSVEVKLFKPHLHLELLE